MGEEKVYCGLILFIGPKLRHSSVLLTVSTDIEYSLALFDHYFKKAACIINRQVIEMNFLAFDYMFSGGFLCLRAPAVTWSWTLTSHPSSRGSHGKGCVCVCERARGCLSIVAFLLCHRIDLCERPIL